MADDKKLKKRFEQIFSEIADLSAASPSTAEGEVDESLEGLFSDQPILAETTNTPQSKTPSARQPAQPSTPTKPDDTSIKPKENANSTVPTTPLNPERGTSDVSPVEDLPVSEPAASSPPDKPQPTSKQSDWANDPLLRMAADDDPTVANLALQTLVNMGKVVKDRALGLAQQPTAPLHDGVIAYLSHLLSQPVVYVPPGTFLMGSDQEADRMAEADEHPQHSLLLPGYWLAKYPVTVANYKSFIAESGCQSAADLNAPDDYPMVGVSWHEAITYCEWLGEYTGLPIALPSEAEWEKAARGTDGRRYPWGNYPPTTSLCNFDRTAVGTFSPQGDSVYGCADVAGNVWEWTRSIYRAYPYRLDDNREVPDVNQARAVRGLTFNDLTRFTRCACRYQLKQNLRLLTLGFRIAISPDIQKNG